MTDDVMTLDWCRGPADELAMANGCWFDWERGAYTVWWIEHLLKLYEGEGAGDPLLLRGCHECDYDLPCATDFDFDDEGKAICLERAQRHAECVKAGHFIDWQYECTMRMFGWVRNSQHWKRVIRRFRKSSIWVAKKNKKSPTLSAWAMYMLAGEGVQGQKVFLAAKDGAQARENTGKHTIEMLNQSEALRSECSLNKNLCRITHEPTRSFLQPLSSSNERTQKSKEGLNGSAFVDEVHIVDREFIARIDRMGISRPEPLFAEFSTVGDDPDSYGMESWTRAEKVRDGEIEDQELFVAIYAAPQDVTDADLDADPITYGRMANPALGHTVDPEELLKDYEASKASPAKLAKCKMYRFNIWQNAASPWLPMVGWDKGRRAFTNEDLYGRTCWSALDLASVRDFAALCLAFPEDNDEMRFLWWFWLPEETAREVQDRIDIRGWEKDPRTNLMLTPGARIDFGYIRSKYRELAGLYDIQELAYDDWNAEQTTSEISEGVRNSSGMVIEPGTGIPRVNFSQSLKDMNEPSKRFEARVIDGKAIHNGDPLARWMIGNATIRPDINGNYKPLKPKDGLKKIDGVVTAIMADAQACTGSEFPEVTYERGAMFA